LEERFILVNQGWAPALWVEVQDHSSLPEYNTNRVTSVGASQQVQQWKTSGVCTQRGLFQVGPTRLQSGDPLGLFSVSIHYSGFEDVLVNPPILHIPPVQIATGGRAGLGKPKRDALEKILSSTGLREYQPGDSLRQIHWPITAHTGSLHVRLMEGVSASDWWILLDLDEQAQVGEGSESTEEFGVILAASLADKGLKEGRQVGLVVNGEELDWLTPKAGDQQRSKILRKLALARLGPIPLSALLNSSGLNLPSASSLIVVTSSTADEWVYSVTPLLRRGIALTVLQMDPLSFGGDRSPENIQSMLANLNVPIQRVTPSFLELPKLTSARRGVWEWRISPTGKAIALRRPEGFAWKTIQ
jgi:uncharacterized protein (DUF58 family)